METLDLHKMCVLVIIDLSKNLKIESVLDENLVIFTNVFHR